MLRVVGKARRSRLSNESNVFVHVYIHNFQLKISSVTICLSIFFYHVLSAHNLQDIYVLIRQHFSALGEIIIHLYIS